MSKDQQEEEMEELVSYSESHGDFPVMAGLLGLGIVVLIGAGIFGMMSFSRSVSTPAMHPSAIAHASMSHTGPSGFYWSSYTQTDLKLATALQAYYLRHGNFPTTLQGIDALSAEPIDDPIPTDWEPLVVGSVADENGLYYKYESSWANPSKKRFHYRLWSVGPDHKDGTPDDRIIVGPEIELEADGSVKHPYPGGPCTFEGLAMHLRVYHKLHGVYPSTKQGLEALSTKPTEGKIPDNWRQVLATPPLDEKGNPLGYERKASSRYGSRVDWRLFTQGKDGKLGTADDSEYTSDMLP